MPADLHRRGRAGGSTDQGNASGRGRAGALPLTATIAACLIAAGALDGGDATLALIAGGYFTCMLVITLAGNMPITLRVFGWDEARADPQEWRRIRQRWDRLHTVRTVLDSAGFALIAAAAVGG